MMHARAIYFDAVGTLIHPVEPVAETYRRIAASQGLSLDLPTVRNRMTAAYIRQEQIDQSAGWRTDEAREFDRWRSIVYDTLPESPGCFDELWHHFSMPSAWRADDDCGHALESLERSGFILGIASNFDQRLAGILPHFPALAPVADRCVISSLVGWRKPGRGFFEVVSAQAGCEPGDIIFVGDDVRNDVQGAGKAGMRAVHFDRMTGGTDVAHEKINRLNELLRRSDVIDQR